MSDDARVRRLFAGIAAHPRACLIASLAAVAAALAAIPAIQIDTSSDAYMHPSHPARVTRDRVEEIFGLKDPVVVAVVNEGPTGVFNPQTLGLVDWLTEAVSRVPGVDPDGIKSLATEKSITGTEDGMLVERFLETPPATQSEAERVRRRVMDQPLVLGSLVARDGTATVIVIQLLDQDLGEEVAREITALLDEAPVGGEQLYVAGEAVTRDYIGTYTNRDTRRLNPITLAVIIAVLFVAYRTASGVLLPVGVIAATVLVTVGLMGATGSPFYGISAGLPVILIGISVADAIHILGRYYEERAAAPGQPAREAVVHVMTVMWRPVVITTVTTIAGFFSLGLSSSMPPLRAFGLFAAAGVAVALALSLVTLPAALALLQPRPSAAFRAARGGAGADVFGRLTARLGGAAIRHPGPVVLGGATLLALSLVGVSRLRVDDDFVTYFKPSEPIFQADRVINRKLDGTRYLDVLIETDAPDQLHRPDYLRRIDALQGFLEGLPRVNGSISIADYVKQMNRAMHENDPEAYRIPDERDLVAQYFLLYSASSDPTDFQEEVDTDYRLANVRARLDSGSYTAAVTAVERTEAYLRDAFDAPGIHASVAGRVNQTYHWIGVLAREHLTGVAIAIVAVWLAISLSMRSALAGALALVPVGLSMLMIYAVMGFAGIWFRLSTSMFAAIAVGLTVDFSVHTLSRLAVLTRGRGATLDEAFDLVFPTTGRALFFNFATIAIGFGVMGLLASTYQLMHFGTLVCVCISAAYVASVTLLPALVVLLRPAFLRAPRPTPALEVPA